jgi:hypothetical protein
MRQVPNMWVMAQVKARGLWGAAVFEAVKVGEGGGLGREAAHARGDVVSASGEHQRAEDAQALAKALDVGGGWGPGHDRVAADQAHAPVGLGLDGRAPIDLVGHVVEGAGEVVADAVEPTGEDAEAEAEGLELQPLVA